MSKFKKRPMIDEDIPLKYFLVFCPGLTGKSIGDEGLVYPSKEDIKRISAEIRELWTEEIEVSRKTGPLPSWEIPFIET